jgi:hypothetical protein
MVHTVRFTLQETKRSIILGYTYAKFLILGMFRPLHFYTVLRTCLVIIPILFINESHSTRINMGLISYYNTHVMCK